MGALLDHLARECVTGDLENEGVGGLNILDIEVLSLYVFWLFFLRAKVFNICLATR